MTIVKITQSCVIVRLFVNHYGIFEDVGWLTSPVDRVEPHVSKTLAASKERKRARVFPDNQTARAFLEEESTTEGRGFPGYYGFHIEPYL